MAMNVIFNIWRSKSRISVEGLCVFTHYFIENCYTNVCFLNTHVDCASYKVIAVQEFTEPRTILRSPIYEFECSYIHIQLQK